MKVGLGEEMMRVDYICDKLTEELIKNNSIVREDKEVYLYCFNTVIELVMNLCATILIGLFMGRVLETIILLLLIMGVRTLSGGWHAKTAWSCFVLSELSYFAIVYLSVWGSENIGMGVMVCSACIISVLIVILGPVSSANRKITKQEYPMLKRKLIALLIIWNVILFMLLYWKLYTCVAVISISYLYILMLESMELVKKQLGFE